MNKINKKGFTLIEMLVVIAIIAVLVAIIIPTVTSATTKAAAATNAANLRSIKAEMVTALLAGDNTKYTFKNDGTITGNHGATFKDLDSKPANATGTFDGSKNFVASYDTTSKEVTVSYDGLSITDWANAAS